MAFTLAQLETQRDTLVAAKNSGVRKVMIDGVIVEYTSVDEMEKALSGLNSQIARLTAGGPVGYTLVQFSKDGRGNHGRD